MLSRFGRGDGAGATAPIAGRNCAISQCKVAINFGYRAESPARPPLGFIRTFPECWWSRQSYVAVPPPFFTNGVINQTSYESLAGQIRILTQLDSIAPRIQNPNLALNANPIAPKFDSALIQFNYETFKI